MYQKKKERLLATYNINKNQKYIFVFCRKSSRQTMTLLALMYRMFSYKTVCILYLIRYKIKTHLIFILYYTKLCVLLRVTRASLEICNNFIGFNGKIAERLVGFLFFFSSFFSLNFFFLYGH